MLEFHLEEPSTSSTEADVVVVGIAPRFNLARCGPTLRRVTFEACTKPNCSRSAAVIRCNLWDDLLLRSLIGFFNVFSLGARALADPPLLGQVGDDACSSCLDASFRLFFFSGRVTMPILCNLVGVEVSRFQRRSTFPNVILLT